MPTLRIPDENTSISFTVTTPTTAFAFAFAIFEKADLTVTVDGVALSGSAYTLSGTLLDGGGYQVGTINLNTAVDDVELTISRNITPQRAEGFGAVTSVPVRSVDMALKRQMAISQDLRRRLAEAIIGAGARRARRPAGQSGQARFLEPDGRRHHGLARDVERRFGRERRCLPARGLQDRFEQLGRRDQRHVRGRRRRHAGRVRGQGL